MTLNAYIKYLTEQLWTYYTNDKKTKKKQPNTINNHWFGLFPFTLKLFFTENKKTINKNHSS